MTTLTTILPLPADVQFIAGLALGLMLILSAATFFNWDILKESDTIMDLPAQISTASLDLQTSFDVANQHAQDATAKEAAAVAARKLAEDSKQAGIDANAALSAKREALKALLDSFYQAPPIPPLAAAPAAPPAAPPAPTP